MGQGMPLRTAWVLILCNLFGCSAGVESSAPVPEPGVMLCVSDDAGRQAFSDVYAVFNHPRCSNCHPDDDRDIRLPRQTNARTEHRFGVTEAWDCTMCHSAEHADTGFPVYNPPGAPVEGGWRLAPREEVFEGHTPASLCHQLRDPSRTGGRDLIDLLHHIRHDELVRSVWSWPGGEPPPISHEEFVEQFSIWVRSGGACPD